MYIKDLVEMDMFPESFPVRVEHSTEKTYQYPAHWHKAIEIAVAKKMDSNIIINNHQYTLQEDDIVFIAGGDIHSYPLSIDRERAFILFDLQGMMSCELLRGDYSLITSSMFIRKNTDKELHTKAMQYIDEILEEAVNIRTGSRFILLARIFDLTALVARNMDRAATLSGGYRKDLLHKIGKVVDYIERNYMEPITLKSAAENAGFSEHYLSRVFNKATGSPFHLYLNKIRIKHAESKIIHNDGNISEIAFSCGFNSIPTFNRRFREIKGCTPLQFRKMQLDHNRRTKGDEPDAKQ
jgi:AraC-like DNA-binding protein